MLWLRGNRMGIGRERAQRVQASRDPVIARFHLLDRNHERWQGYYAFPDILDAVS